MGCQPIPRPQPTLAGFTQFIYTVMGIPEAAAPSGSEYITWAYDTAIATVHPFLRRAAGPIYLQAVYNFAGDWFVTWAPDQPGVLYPTDNPQKLGYLAWLRQKWNLTGFVAGVVQSSNDQTTGQTLVVPDAFKTLDIQSLLQLRTPWGRAYLALAQKVGGNWGIT